MKIGLRSIVRFGVLAAISVSAVHSFAAGLILVDEAFWHGHPVPPPDVIRPPWPRPRPPVPRPYSPIETKSVKVSTRITEQVAVTTIRQEFHNPNPSQLEGTFVFPIPKGAHLDKFTMEIDGRQAEAELLPAEKARAIYEEIVRKARDPGLLEYADRDLFRVRVFPIEAHGDKKVTLSYTQVLPADDGLISYTLPLSPQKYSPKPVQLLEVRVELDSKRPLKTVYSASHKVKVERLGPNRATASLESAELGEPEDFSLYFASAKDELGLNLLAHRLPGEDGFFLLLASPGAEESEKKYLPKDVVFVLDTSGSMAGKKLEQAKRALLFCVENLNDQDRFDIVRFSTEAEPLFDRLAEASRGSRDRAADFIKDLKPIGGTAIDDALKKALAAAPADSGGAPRIFVVIFLTDGRPTLGVTDEDQILANVTKANIRNTRVFCFGIGADVNTHLLDKLSDQTRAISQYVLPEEDIEVKVSSFFSKIRQPVLANPALRFTGDIRATKLYPSPLPDLFKGQQLVLVGRYSGDGSCAAVIEGTVDGATRKLAYDLNLPAENRENEFIPRLWASRRVGYLLDEIRLHGENRELREEATELARKYGIVTPYTAYLIVEDEAQRGIPTRNRSLQSLEQDRTARNQAATAWREFRTLRDGDAAVADSRFSMELKAADAPAVARVNGGLAFQRRYGLAPSTSSGGGVVSSSLAGAERLVEYSQQAKTVGGRTFFLNENQWTEAAVQKLAEAPKVRLQFGSPEYFDFARRNAQALPWLALGRNVQFVLNGTVYEVFER